MRFVFHNPHGLIWYKTHYYYFANELKSVAKCEYLFDYFYKDKKNKIYVYIDKYGWEVPPVIDSLSKFSTPLLNFYTWALINRLNPFRFKVITDIKKLRSDDVLMTFLYEHFTSFSGNFNTSREPMIEHFKKTKAYKVVHLSHYGFYAGLGSKNTSEADIDLFVSENNLAKNSKFFKHYYQWYKKDVYVLPFVFQSRFIRTKNFKDRTNKAVATGTITFPMVDNDFLSFFGDNQLHPMRLNIFNNSKKNIKYIDSFIYKYKIPVLSVPLKKEFSKTNNKTDNEKFLSNKFYSLPLVKSIIKNLSKLIRIPKLFKKQLAIILEIFTIFFKGESTENLNNEMDYYKIDIVKLYNEYKMFVVPEEAIDLPGIGFVEGMACGSAFIGKRDPMYEDVGLIDKVNYIGYDGTLNDLIEKITYYQYHGEELEAIAQEGYNFVNCNFTGKVVVENFLSKLKEELIIRKCISDNL